MTYAAKLRLAAEILVAYVRMRWAMGRRELPAIVAAVRSRHRNVPPSSREERSQLAASLMRLLHLLPTDSRCLVRSLVFLNLLERRGMTAELVIGVRSDPDFLAHAWVEYEGEPLLPSGDGEFAPLTRI